MRLLIVSNRLPLNGVQKDGKLVFEQSAGGLVSGLSAYLDSLKSTSAQDIEYVWIGWPGITVQDKMENEVKSVLSDLHSSPVFLSEEAMDKFYLGFCNKIIWPLFHYFPSNTIYDKEYWLQYQDVNKIFRDAVLEVIQRLQGYKLFLENNPQWREQVVLLMVVVPSRVGVEHYQQMKREIDELVGEINGRFGTLNWTPIIYQYKFLPLDSLLAMYRQSDVALITPLRDGMNLIAKEYVAARTDQTGVLILSEMAGAAKELGEALIINPNNLEAIAEALQQALTMPETEQKKRNASMQRRLERYDVMRWSGDFIQELLQVQKGSSGALPLGEHKQTLQADFQRADKRLLLLDYDGTLVPFTDSPDQAKPDRELLDLLKSLTITSTDVVIISGRDRATLETWLGFLDITLIAEHGAWLKRRGEQWSLSKPLVNSWKRQLMPILEMYADRLHGSFIEKKEVSLAWHYRQADTCLSAACTRELMDELVTFTSNVDLHILQGNKVIEVRNSEVTKGSAGLSLAFSQDYDFILAIGDDTTDEDLFASLALEHSWPGVLPPHTFTIRVGTDKSQACYFIPNYLEVRKMLRELTAEEI